MYASVSSVLVCYQRGLFNRVSQPIIADCLKVKLEQSMEPRLGVSGVSTPRRLCQTNEEGFYYSVSQTVSGSRIALANVKVYLICLLYPVRLK